MTRPPNELPMGVTPGHGQRYSAGLGGYAWDNREGEMQKPGANPRLCVRKPKPAEG